MEILDFYKDELEELFKDKRFTVLLCGPSLNDLTKKGARLRKQIKESLELENIDVILGEDDGLENVRLKFGHDAQTNEKHFIKNHTNAVILIATSVGAFCELGLFSDLVIHNCDKIVDFILLISQEHEEAPSYLKCGPATLLQDFGYVRYVDFDSYDPEEIISRLKRRRAVFTIEGRGRPPGKQKT